MFGVVMRHLALTKSTGINSIHYRRLLGCGLLPRTDNAARMCELLYLELLERWYNKKTTTQWQQYHR
jgi:hypothetical protein